MVYEWLEHDESLRLHHRVAQEVAKGEKSIVDIKADLITFARTWSRNMENRQVEDIIYDTKSFFVT